MAAPVISIKTEKSAGSTKANVDSKERISGMELNELSGITEVESSSLMAKRINSGEKKARPTKQKRTYPRKKSKNVGC